MSKWEALKDLFKSAGIYIFSTQDVVNGNVKGRIFAPALGITEDPATGSANGPMACHLHHHNLCSFPAVSLQSMEMGRPSSLQLNLSKDDTNQIESVFVGVKSVLIGKGAFFI